MSLAHPRRRQLALAAAGAVFLAWCLWTCVVRGLADAHYTQARLLLGMPVLLGTVTEDRPAPAPARVTAARAHLRSALALEPDNPHFVEQFARVEEMRALALAPAEAGRRQALRQSAAAFRLAARMRPGSSYTWADLARVKFRMDDMDFEFFGALERAARLGPWEGPVQLALVDVGLASWRFLPSAAMPLVAGALDRALLHQAHAVGKLAAAHGSLPQVCARSGLPSRLAAACVRK